MEYQCNLTAYNVMIFLWNQPQVVSFHKKIGALILSILTSVNKSLEFPFSAPEEAGSIEQLSEEHWTDFLAKHPVNAKTVQKYLEEAETWGNKINERRIKLKEMPLSLSICLPIYQQGENKRAKQMKSIYLI